METKGAINVKIEGLKSYILNKENYFHKFNKIERSKVQLNI